MYKRKDIMTCCIAAGCYVNCVLGYDNICNVNMLHVLSCTFLHDKDFQTKTEIQDIQPSTRPRTNLYQVPAGKQIVFMVFLCFMFSRSCVFVVLLLYVFVRL